MPHLIWIAQSVRHMLLEYRRDFFPLETGGILLGYSVEKNDRCHWVVTSGTGPGKKAKHSRYSFTPDDTYHIQEAERHFDQTGGREYYLGDWHTHPNGSCASSMIDRFTLYRNARRADHLQFRSLMLIVGGEINSASYGAHIEKASNGIFRALSPSQPLKPLFFD